MAVKCCKVPFHHRVKEGVSKVLKKYGQFVGAHPIPFIVVPIILYGGLGAGMAAMSVEDAPDKLYFPRDNRAEKEMRQLLNIFPPYSDIFYTDFSVVSPFAYELRLLFRVRDSSKSLYDDDVAAEINTHLGSIDIQYSTYCASLDGVCVDYGRKYIANAFKTQVQAGSVTYPQWTDPSDNSTVDLSEFVADYRINETTKVLLSARVLLVRYVMKSKSYFYSTFLANMAQTSLTYSELYYENSESQGDELKEAVEGDTFLFVGTILLVICYSCLVTVGGDAVSTRALLALAGVLATALGILGAVGFLSLLDQDFAIINFVVPFLLIGIGVDDMFLLMTSWSETLGHTDLSVPERVGRTLAFAGVGMTVTSVTDFLAFMIGYSSVFFSVRSFCLYAGVAVLFVYFSHFTFFSGCLALHGRRMYSSRHCFTCRPAKPRPQLQEEGKSKPYAFFCGGQPPEQPTDDESLCEKFPRLFVPRLVSHRPLLYLILVIFAALLAVSIYGAVNIELGLNFKDLVLKSSYYYDFITRKDLYFPQRIVIAFHITSEQNYADPTIQQYVKDMLTAAKADGEIQSDFEHCWLTSFLSSTFFQNASLPTEVRWFLQQNPVYKADIIIDPNDVTKIVASRCSVYSLGFTKQYDIAKLMTRMREVAGNSPLPVIAFQKDFELYEQYLATLPATLQTVGFAVLAIVVVCLIFLPHPFMVALTTVNIVMIICNIFGCMYFWGITLSSITMIHLVMSVGFSVDFSAHVCSAYLMSDSITRQQRAYDAITHAASPILNGGVSSLVGVLLLSTSEAYVFSTFFKIMMLVMIFGILNSVIFLPAMLCLFGPQNSHSSSPENNEEGNNGHIPNGTTKQNHTRSVQSITDLNVKMSGNDPQNRPASSTSISYNSARPGQNSSQKQSDTLVSQNPNGKEGTEKKSGEGFSARAGSPNRVGPSPEASREATPRQETSTAGWV